MTPIANILAALDKAEREATPGPWRGFTHSRGNQFIDRDGLFHNLRDEHAFIALVRNNIRAVLDHIAKQESDFADLILIERMRYSDAVDTMAKQAQELVELRATAQRDYDGMRDMQAKFMKADHELRELKEENEKRAAENARGWDAAHAKVKGLEEDNARLREKCDLSIGQTERLLHSCAACFEERALLQADLRESNRVKVWLEADAVRVSKAFESVHALWQAERALLVAAAEGFECAISNLCKDSYNDADPNCYVSYTIAKDKMAEWRAGEGKDGDAQPRGTE